MSPAQIVSVSTSWSVKMEIQVDAEVLGHLLIIQHKEGGTFSEIIQKLLDEQAEEPLLPIKLPRKRKNGRP